MAWPVDYCDAWSGAVDAIRPTMAAASVKMKAPFEPQKPIHCI